MALCLNTLNAPIQWCVLRKGYRVFGLLGKVSSAGVASFRREDVGKSLALTAEHGSLRMEQLAGDEEVTGERMFLPNPFSTDYGVTGGPGPQETARIVFGITAQELEQLVKILQRGSFPVLGFSQTELKCSVSLATIPACWPHVVISNLALYGNVVSLESFVRILVASIPQGQLSTRFPSLQPVFKRMMKLMVLPRRGMPYYKEALNMSPVSPWAPLKA